jgi:glyoxylate carboligase
MAGLERAYGGAASTCVTTSTPAATQQQGNGKAAAKQLPVLQFAQQAEFLQLASIALSAVQVSLPAAAEYVGGRGGGTRSCSTDPTCW